MSVARRVRLRVGVIGLGRLWEARYKPALSRMRDRFQVTAVYDQVQRRAEIEARQFGCAAIEGLTALIERPDVDAVFVLTPQWFGLHPILLACRVGKPVYCALSLVDRPAEIDELAREVEASGVAFMPELARRFYPATLRLRELLVTSLGPPRLILGQSRQFGFDRYGQPGPSTQLAPAPLLIDPGGNLLDWCRFVFQSPPSALQGWGSAVLPGPEPHDFESFTAEFPGGGMAQMAFQRYHQQPWGEATRFLPPPGIQVFAERGAAWLELPERILWSDADGTHEERLPLEPGIGEVLVEQFHRLVRGDQALAPGVRDVQDLAHWVETLRKSQAERRALAPSPGS